METLKHFGKNLGIIAIGLVAFGIIGTALTALTAAVGSVATFAVLMLVTAAAFTYFERKHRAEIRDLEAPYEEPEVEVDVEPQPSVIGTPEERAEFTKLKQQAHEAYWRRVRAEMARETDAEFEAWLLKRRQELAQ